MPQLTLNWSKAMPAKKISPKRSAAKSAAKAESKKTKPKRESTASVPGTPSTEEEKEQHRMASQNFLNQLKQAKKRIEEAKPLPGDEEKNQLLEKYSKLNRYDSEKSKLLELWSKDKSLGWWKSYEEVGGSMYKEKAEGISGWGSRFDVAAFLGVPVEHASMDYVLGELKCDDVPYLVYFSLFELTRN